MIFCLFINYFFSVIRFNTFFVWSWIYYEIVSLNSEFLMNSFRRCCEISLFIKPLNSILILMYSPIFERKFVRYLWIIWTWKTCNSLAKVYTTTWAVKRHWAFCTSFVAFKYCVCSEIVNCTFSFRGCYYYFW